jgi:hypothetical protein
MITHEDIQLERIHLLEPAIENLKSDCNRSEDLLLRFMLADARLWVFGHPHALAETFAEFRNHLQSIGKGNLSDVEICCNVFKSVFH